MLCVVALPEIAFLYQASRCDSNNQATQQKSECWAILLKNDLQKGGPSRALERFSQLYDRFPAFSEPGECHRNAHRLGDMTYYEFYVSNPNMEALQFTPDAQVCTLGFFHGFFEHLFQNNPSENFITEMCEALSREYDATIGAMREACYHGAGHGLMLANSERVPISAAGDPDRFIREPLRSCGSLSKADRSDIEQCYQGVFTLLVSWMSDQNYGLSFPKANVFSLCERLQEPMQDMCFNQFADRFYHTRGLSVKELVEIVMRIEDYRHRFRAFRASMLDIIGRAIFRGSERALVNECRDVPQSLFETCIGSFPHAIFNSGFPEAQFTKALAFCGSSEVAALGPLARAACFSAVGSQLSRFFPPAELPSLCEQFPPAERSLCDVS